MSLHSFMEVLKGGRRVGGGWQRGEGDGDLGTLDTFLVLYYVTYWFGN